MQGGGASPSGNWSDWNWSTENSGAAAGGNRKTSQWNNGFTNAVPTGIGNVAAFSAGNSATGAFTVNSDQNGVILTGMRISEGDVTIAGSATGFQLNATPTGGNIAGHGQGNSTYALFNIRPGARLHLGENRTDDATPGDGLRKIGDGFMETTVANTYTGPTQVSNGEFRVAAGGSITSDTTVQTGAIFSGAGAINGDLTLDAGSTFNPGDGAPGNLSITGTGNAVTFDDNATLNFELATPFQTKAAAAQSGDHMTLAAGNTIDFDGNLNLIDIGGFKTGFYELVSVDAANETISFTNDSSDFTGVPNSSYAYRIETGSIDLVVAGAPDVGFGTSGLSTLNLNLGTFGAGATGSTGYSINNNLGTEFLRLFADDIMLSGTSGDLGLFSPGYSGTPFDLDGGASMGLTAGFLGSSTNGTYNASYTVSWDDFTGGVLGNLAGLRASNGLSDIVEGDFYLPQDYMAGELTLNLSATVFGAIPEPSRAMLVFLGIATTALRRRR